MGGVARSKSGLGLSTESEHRSNGRLIARIVTAPAPQITCLRLSCILSYLFRTLRHVVLMEYHAKRVRYAEKNRDRDIPERYRTGEPAPQTIRQALIELIKIWR